MSTPLARPTMIALGNMPSTYAAGTTASSDKCCDPRISAHRRGFPRECHEHRLAVVHRRLRRDRAIEGTEHGLAVAVDALRVRPVERHAGEELRGHAPALARVVAAAAAAG